MSPCFRSTTLTERVALLWGSNLGEPAVCVGLGVTRRGLNGRMTVCRIRENALCVARSSISMSAAKYAGRLRARETDRPETRDGSADGVLKRCSSIVGPVKIALLSSQLRELKQHLVRMWCLLQTRVDTTRPALVLHGDQMITVCTSFQGSGTTSSGLVAIPL